MRYNLGDTLQIKGHLCIVLKDKDCKNLCGKCAWISVNTLSINTCSCLAPSDYCPLPPYCYVQCIDDKTYGGI